MEETQRDARSLKIALAIYILIFAGKFVAYLATGVMAMLAGRGRTRDPRRCACARRRRPPAGTRR